MSRPVPVEKIAGIAIAFALHAASLWGLWQHRLIPGPQEAMTLFVDFIAPPAPEKKEEPRRVPPPKPKPIEKPPRMTVAETPSVAPADFVVASTPPPQPVPEPIVAPPPARLPAGPVTLATELAVACPERTPPTYPAAARRFGEEGTVVLRVELDETGQVTAVQVKSSSGYPRLDETALTAVRNWQCNPSRRNGQAVRAVAMQPFKFVLQGN